jgi:hypothetical protein
MSVESRASFACAVRRPRMAWLPAVTTASGAVDVSQRLRLLEHAWQSVALETVGSDVEDGERDTAARRQCS